MTMIEPASREPVEGTVRKSFTASERQVIVARQQARCARCGIDQVIFVQDDHTRVYRPMQFDHILPLELGGEHSIVNAQALCIDCHKAKTREDIKRITKAKRLARDNDPTTRRKSPHRLRSRGFPKADELK